MIPTLVDMSSSKAYHQEYAANLQRAARSTSIDINAGNHLGGGGTSARPLHSAFEKLARRSKSLSGPASSPVHGRYEGKLVWRDRKGAAQDRDSRRTRNIAIGSVAALCLLYLTYAGLTGTSVLTEGSKRPVTTRLLPARFSNKLYSLTGSSRNCNPYAVAGKFHVDYNEPSNNYWEPTGSTACRADSAPRFVRQLRNADYDGLEWMNNKTVILFGDSIERDHVSLFCSLMGREAEVIKGNNKLAVTAGGPGDAVRLGERRKKDRTQRIALKGMMESTLPRVCYIEELNFMMANVYHFGLDEEDYWKHLDQFHPPGTVEERLEAQVQPLIAKLQTISGRTNAPDLIEISSGMYDVARWAKQDIAAQQSTENPLSEERLGWYKSRASKLLALLNEKYPNAVKTWRATTLTDDQAQELDYFNDRFGHSPATITPHFSPNRVHQIDGIMRELVQPYDPVAARSDPQGSKAITSDFVYNAWASLVRGTPAHQFDRLHGGDLATPATVLWADVLLWHLRQGSVAR